MDYYIAAYDISDPSRLLKVQKTLKDFGSRLQFSVFECYLTAKNFVLLKERLAKTIVPEEDRVIFFRLCPSCKGNIETLGRQHQKPEPDKPIIV